MNSLLNNIESQYIIIELNELVLSLFIEKEISKKLKKIKSKI
jgi:hypothetical protein